MPLPSRGSEISGGNEPAQGLHCGKIETAVSFIENKKSCGISFEDIGQKVYKRLIGI